MNPLKKVIAEGSPALGVVLSADSPLIAEYTGRTGFDWAMIDLQHGMSNWDTVSRSLHALEVGGMKGIVRVGWTDQMQIMRALDLGAVGVIVPMICTPEDARLAAQATHYPPRGIRSFGPIRNMTPAHITEADNVCILIIETAEALANLDEIVATPGVDGVMVGPMDLALSLGCDASFGAMQKEVVDAIGKMVEVCRKHGKISGCFALGPENADELLGRGVQMIALGADLFYILKGLQAEKEVANSLKKKHQKS